MTEEEKQQREEERREKNRIRNRQRVEKQRARREAEQQQAAIGSTVEGANPAATVTHITQLSPGFVHPLSVQVNCLKLLKYRKTSRTS